MDPRVGLVSKVIRVKRAMNLAHVVPWATAGLLVTGVRMEKRVIVDPTVTEVPMAGTVLWDWAMEDTSLPSILRANMPLFALNSCMNSTMATVLSLSKVMTMQ